MGQHYGDFDESVVIQTKLQSESLVLWLLLQDFIGLDTSASSDHATGTEICGNAKRVNNRKGGQ